jgi:acid phosphatase family membrane protein YuiD
MKKVSKAMYGKAMMKTGGMTNANAKVSALKTAGSKGVKSGVNSKVTASKVAKGRVGGTSAAPKKAKP